MNILLCVLLACVQSMYSLAQHNLYQSPVILLHAQAYGWFECDCECECDCEVRASE